MQAKDKLSALVFTQMLLARFNIEVSLKTVTIAAQTWLSDASGASRSQNFVILLVMLFHR